MATYETVDGEICLLGLVIRLGFGVLDGDVDEVGVVGFVGSGEEQTAWEVSDGMGTWRDGQTLG